jgi:hypothetical protein
VSFPRFPFLKARGFCTTFLQELAPKPADHHYKELFQRLNVAKNMVPELNGEGWILIMMCWIHEGAGCNRKWRVERKWGDGNSMSINSMIRLQKVSHEESQRKINQPEGEVCLLLKKGKRMANIY